MDYVSSSVLSWLLLLYLFGRTIPEKKPAHTTSQLTLLTISFSTDTILSHAKRRLTADQIIRLNALENSVSEEM